MSNVTGLLERLDHLVRNDGAPSGLSGRIAVGVKSADRVRWWVADFGRAVETRITHQTPEKADVLVGFGDREVVTGDRDLLSRFVARYVRNQSALAVRAGGR